MESEKSSQEEKIVVEEYCRGKLVRTREVTAEELALENKLQTQKGMETRARMKQIREIVRDNGFTSFESVLNYLSSGGDSMACFRENLMKDKSYWMQEINLEKKQLRW